MRPRPHPVMSRTRLIDPLPSQALKRLRTAEFKPYVIFVKPRVPESRRRRSTATSPAGGEHSRVTVSFLSFKIILILFFVPLVRYLDINKLDL